MSYGAVLNINNFEHLLSEDNFSNLLSALSNNEDLEGSLQKLVEKKPLPEVKKIVTVATPLKKTVVVAKTKSHILRKEVAVLLAITFYATSCVDIKETHTIENPVFSTSSDNTSAVVEKTITAKVNVKHESIGARLARFFIPIRINSLDPDSINSSAPTINDDEDSIKQPIIVFDARPVEELLSEAKTLLLERNGTYDQAINDLKSIISTQPPDTAREAHELLGYAYEKSKNYNRAMKEYQRYLGLYTEDNEDRTRVRQRLMTLEILEPTGVTLGRINKTKEPHHGDSFEFYGSSSNYFYVMKNSAEGGSNQSPEQVNWISGVQASMIQTHNQYVLSSRVRLTEVKDFSSNNGNRTNLSAAYVDFANTFAEYNIRAGRQSSVAGAVGKFDGISANIKVTDDLKLSVAAGVPYTGPGSNTKRNFEGIEADWRINRDWTTELYINRGVADGLLERMAIGNSLAYGTNKTSLLLRTEYDTVYHSLNLISFQGNYYAKNFDAFAIFERRRSPMPYGDVALNLSAVSLDKQYYNSVGDLLLKSGLTSDEIYKYISQSTPIATSAVLGFREKINKNWEATINAQVTNLSTVPGFNLNTNFDPIPIQVGDSKNYSLTAHLKGDNVFLKNNNIEFVASDSTGARKSTFVTVADNYRFGDRNRDSISAILRYDTINETFGQMNTLSGVLRGFYAVSEKGMLEAQYSMALTKNKDTLMNQPSNTNQTVYIGFRYDF